MKQQILFALPLLGAVVARPTTMRKREVPGEHAHENVLQIIDPLVAQNNPDNLGSAVFGLLGAKAAAEGAGNIADADCLQQAIADQAFTNAKAAGDVDGQTFALIYRALERNSGSVGLASPPCASIQAVNVEIAALQQHQDPAGDGAQDLNKQIAEELARQIDSIGGDVSLANEASTFAPGEIGDPTAKGNTCDDANDLKGCINSQNLRVDDLSDAEIQAALTAAGGISAGNSSAAANATQAAASSAKSAAAGNADAAAATATAAAASAATATAAASAGKENENAAAGDDAGADAAADFGGCDATISFGIPSDRNEDAFFPTDATTFNHGSALNIAVISNFICTQLKDKCSANEAAVDACDAAATASDGQKGQAAADAFNQALGQ